MGEFLSARLELSVRRLGLSQEELSELTGSSTRSVARYLAGQVAPQRETKERILEIHYLGALLSELMEPEDANLWLYTPNQHLNHKTPASALSAGDFDGAVRAVEYLLKASRET